MPQQYKMAFYDLPPNATSLMSLFVEFEEPK